MKKTVFLVSLLAIILSSGFTAEGAGKKSATEFKKGKWVTIFDGTSTCGWRGYNRETLPAAWVIEDGALKIMSGANRRAQGITQGGDVLFDHKFSNFELSFEWKVADKSNSGVFYLAQEVPGQPSWLSAPEYQILDNANHPDGKMGKNGNRQSASLYDMIPAAPQNALPVGEWNTGGIIVKKGKVTHLQNGKKVVEFTLWDDSWKALVEDSKFKGVKTFINAGGDSREGYIVLQDHGDDVWFRNIRVRVL